MGRDSFDRKKRRTKDRGIAPEHTSINFSSNGFRLVNIIIVYNKHLKVGYRALWGVIHLTEKNAGQKTEG
jgi:hypothetical protein